MRSLAASQPGDIQVVTRQHRQRQYAFHGKHYAYHLDIEAGQVTRQYRSALRAQFITLLGERPAQTFIRLPSLVPDGERAGQDRIIPWA